MQRDLDLDLLRTFVAVAHHRNFTRAAAGIGRTQSAVSMQIRRLEAIVGVALFERTRTAVTITPAGETLQGYAHRLLRLNDEALARLREPEVNGLVRIGAPDDYATCLLPPVLSAFSKAHPLIQVEVTCEGSQDLRPRLDDGRLDLALVTQAPDAPGGQVIRREPLHWVAAPDFVFDPAAVVPLAVAPQGCACRALALAALDAQDRPWRIAYTTRSLALIQSAVTAGLGVSVLEAFSIPAGLVILDGRDGFPPLPDVLIALYRASGRASRAVDLAADYIMRALGPSPRPAESRSLSVASSR
ncbi:LysR substrate-binding domain-containing protein [Roseospira goensis]|uniref:DNA-binding transcriptional LysR family regulator n=1 Tax=Roseospira goensis TaxID=391922 RepID=A0A7W6S1F3_9PROT|nr:LysR substrate-binding domain-containing protein [Roseospira goensis]MBB4286449.1 DNA-binding transcriptional LysR family regulator [Roseospira goensis]